jgi:hypothetical protein
LIAKKRCTAASEVMGHSGLPHCKKRRWRTFARIRSDTGTASIL